MRSFLRHSTTLAAAGLVLALAGCSGGDLDDAGGPDTVMEVDLVTISPATASLDPVTGQCKIVITDATVTLRNKAKNAFSGASPFNDIVLEEVRVSYRWDDPGISTAPQVMSLGGTIPAGNQTVQVKFPPVPLGLLTDDMIGNSVNLDMVFVGRQVSGALVEATGGGVWSIGGGCI